MPRVVVIGGTGHVGTYMVPRLVEAGHDVVVVARNKRQPYLAHAAWNQVERSLSIARLRRRMAPSVAHS